MIQGVEIKELKIYPDDRGMFTELVKVTDDFVEPHPFAQISHTVTYPGVIKAFHWHKLQTDYWYCVAGSIRVALVDLREDSSTAGEQASIVLGEWSRRIIKIPPYVAHGYQVLGATPAQLIYYTTRPYNPEQPDEERIAWDDPSIGYDWVIHNR
jgi:dTDP-4-dehydrorhamnose 3,5-epimerase